MSWYKKCENILFPGDPCDTRNLMTSNLLVSRHLVWYATCFVWYDNFIPCRGHDHDGWCLIWCTIIWYNTITWQLYDVVGFRNDKEWLGMYHESCCICHIIIMGEIKNASWNTCPLWMESTDHWWLPRKWLVMPNFDVSSGISLSQLLRKLSSCQWFMMLMIWASWHLRSLTAW